MPDTIAVYDFELFDKATRSWKLADRMGTLPAIAAEGGVPMRGSRLVVMRTRLDEDGFLVKTRIIG